MLDCRSRWLIEIVKVIKVVISKIGKKQKTGEQFLG